MGRRSEAHRLPSEVSLSCSTYCGVDQDEDHRFPQEAPEAGVVFVCQHIVEVAGEDTHLVNDQLLCVRNKRMSWRVRDS